MSLTFLPSGQAALVGPGAQTELRQFNARYYGLTKPLFVSVNTVCTTTIPLITYPSIDPLLVSSNIQHWIHNAKASIDHVLPSGEVATTRFVCYFQRHRKLRRNGTLNVKGEVVIMRAEANGSRLTDMNELEAGLADQVAKALAPALRKFQGRRRIRFQSIVIPVADV
ncbi:hypothetical protein R3P38DRAFT_3175028 [Favolaschia claudopus]|uniref:Uncharacterized protein n=1 Tax=Favolaschia claudopus TaxID=2862362 RepID=A0AAW0DBR7_9AGAR